MNCAYCRKEPAVHLDHIMSRALRRRFPDFTDTVPACFKCNMIKGTRRLIPPSWAHRQAELEELTSHPWQVWNGDPRELGAQKVLI